MKLPVLRFLFCLMVSCAILTGAARAQSVTAGACPAIVATRPTVVPPQRFKAGDIVPAFAVDEPLQWLECAAPELPSGAARDAKRRVFLFITIDEKGAVADVKPRGAIDPEGFFDAAVAAVRRWKSSAPRWKTLPVRCSFAADIIFDPTPAAAAQPIAKEPEPVPVAPAPVQANPPAAPAANSPVQNAPAPVAAPKEPEPKPAPVAEPASAPAQTPPQAVAPPPATEPKPAAPAEAPVAAPAKSLGAPAAEPPAAASNISRPPTTTTAPVSQPPAPAAQLPTAAEPTPAPPAPADTKPAEPAPSCPQFFVLPGSEQSRRTYRAGELVPNAYLDEKPVWAQCPWPDFSGLAARTAMVIVMIDDKGAVREVRPRGQPANGIFQRTRATLLGWRISPPPRYKTLPVWTSTALDIRNDGTAQRAAESSAPATSGAATAATPVSLPGAAPVSAPPTEQNAPSSTFGEAPFVEEFYYKVKWGFADEFWRLFLKNHWPMLRKQIETGRILEVHADKPVYHATEEGRWDYRVTIVWRSAAARFATVDTAALERQLFADQETFHREEQRRFELLLAHWDVPVSSVPLPK